MNQKYEPDDGQGYVCGSVIVIKPRSHCSLMLDRKSSLWGTPSLSSDPVHTATSYWTERVLCKASVGVTRLRSLKSKQLQNLHLQLFMVTSTLKYFHLQLPFYQRMAGTQFQSQLKNPQPWREDNTLWYSKLKNIIDTVSAPRRNWNHLIIHTN